MVFGNGRVSAGKKILEGDGVSLICDTDENGNIIPGTCVEYLEKTPVHEKVLMPPGRRM